jgi:AcrR family transcriptional regulator
MAVAKEMGGMAETARQRRHRATREEILVVARGLMLEEGVNGLSIREVARRTGFGPASLYTYFAGKEEIVAAVTKESFRGLDEYLARVPVDLPLEMRLVGLGAAYLRFARDNPADLACIVTTGLGGAVPQGVDAAVLDAPLARFAAALQRGVDAGMFARADEAAVAERAYGLWALVHGLAVLAQVRAGRPGAGVAADPERVLRAAIDGLVSGGGGR